MTDASFLAGRHVIVVEDEEIIRDIIVEVLSDDGVRVTAFESGEAMIARLEELEPPRTLVVDVRLPGMDGFETARAARKRWGELPAVFISGDLRPLVRGTGKRDLCLMKPFTAETLRQVLVAAGG